MFYQIALICTGALLASGAIAQTVDVPVVATWQVSNDAGGSWSNSLTVPFTQSSVRARMQISWTSALPTSPQFLSGAHFDGYVRVAQGGGAADSVSGISMLRDGFFVPAQSPVLAQRVSADLIKIDQGDSAPLGQGNFIVVNNAPFTGGVTFGNPITVFEYQLQLDGSAGTREIGSVYRSVLPVGISLSLPQGTTANFIASTQPATLVVLPAPTALALAGVGGVVLLRRWR